MNKKIILSVLALTLLMPLSYATDIQESTIYVDANVNSEFAPDTVKIRFYVENSGIKLAELKEKNDKIVNTAISEIKKKLGENESVKTITYRVNDIYSYKDKVRVFQKYEVVNGFEVKLKNLSMVSQIIKDAMDLGINRVNSPNFYIEKGDDICNTMMASAIEIAKKRAQYLASASGTSLGKIKSINPHCSLSSSVTPMYYNSSLKMMNSASDAALGAEALNVVEPGTMNVSANVNMTYYLK